MLQLFQVHETRWREFNGNQAVREREGMNQYPDLSVNFPDHVQRITDFWFACAGRTGVLESGGKRPAIFYEEL